MSLSVAVNIDFHGYLQFLCIGFTLQYATENLSDGQFLFHCWKNRPTFSYRGIEMGGCVLKLEPLIQASLQRRDKKKRVCSLGRILFRWRNLTQNAALTFPANYDLKKYSCATCRGEQSPSKFDTYSRQLKSMFGCASDLNTLTVRQLKSTFGTKRLTLPINFDVCIS